MAKTSKKSTKKKSAKKPFDTSEIQALGKQLSKQQLSSNTSSKSSEQQSQYVAIALLLGGLFLIIGLGILYVKLP